MRLPGLCLALFASGHGLLTEALGMAGFLQKKLVAIFRIYFSQQYINQVWIKTLSAFGF